MVVYYRYDCVRIDAIWFGIVAENVHEGTEEVPVYLGRNTLYFYPQERVTLVVQRNAVSAGAIYFAAHLDFDVEQSAALSKAVNKMKLFRLFVDVIENDVSGESVYMGCTKDPNGNVKLEYWTIPK